MAAEIRFEPRGDSLSDEEAVYWKTVLSRSGKVGIEIEVIEPAERRVGEVIKELKHRLQPSKDNRRLGENGVLTISRELQGLEVKVVGRVPIFDKLLEHLRSIYDHLAELDCFPDGKCGMHQHFIGVHLGNDVPAIVMDNLWNLTRRYAAALRFITSCGPDRKRLTRKSTYCEHDSLMRHDAATRGCREIQECIRDSEDVKEHNGFLNMENVVFGGDGPVRAMHFEYRFPDMELAPLAATAKSYLCCAVVLRAAELSKYGVVVNDEAEHEQSANLLNKLSNNLGADAMSDTSRLSPRDLEALRASAASMIRELKPICSYFDPRVFRILSLLANTPTSLLRDSGNDWEEIENILASTVMDSQIDCQVKERLIRMIELGELDGSPGMTQWIAQAARALDVSPVYLAKYLNDLGNSREVRWDEELGTAVFHYR